MATVNTLNAEKRERAGKGAARATRRAGLVPAVIYGDNKDAVLISLTSKDMERMIRTPGFMAHLCDLKVGGETLRTLPRDVQLDPVTDRAIHVDFMRVGANTTITVDVPLAFINQEKSPGLKRGGLLNVVMHAVTVRCKADAIPDQLTLDLDGADVGTSLHMSQLTLPAGVKTLIDDENFTLATVVAPAAMVSEETGAPASGTTEATKIKEPKK